MARYFFDVNDGREIRDTDGSDAAGPDEARTRAKQLVSDCMQGPDRLSADGDAIAVDVRDDAGNHVVTARLVLSVAVR